MEQILTEEEVRVMYQEKQREPFPVRKNWMGIILAAIYLLGSVALWGLFLWVIGKVAGL